MQCKKCGTEIKEGCLFCHNCGEAIQMVPDYEPEIDDLIQVGLARAKTKSSDKTAVRQLSEKTEEGIEALKKVNWKLIFIVTVIVLGIIVFGVSYGSVLRNQEPGAMQQTERPEPEKEETYVPKPKFNRQGGTYSYYLSVELISETEGTIYYTLDGSTPEETSYIYSQPLDLSEGTTVIRAFVMDKNGNSSDVASEVYEIEFGAPDKPTIIPASGAYTGEQYVRILVPDHCTVYYTLDGSVPTEASEIYTGEFLMPTGTTTTVQAVVRDEYGVFSEVSSVTYQWLENLPEEIIEQ